MRVDPPTRYDLRYLARAKPRVPQGLLAGLQGALHQVLYQLLELRAGYLHHQMLGTARIGGYEREIHLGLHRVGKLDLGFLGGLPEPLDGHLVVAEVYAGVLFELRNHVVDDPPVEIVSPEVRVAVCGLHLYHVVSDLEHRDVESSAPEVVNDHHSFLFLVESVRESGRGRLVYYALHVKTGYFPRVLGGLALAVIKVRGHCDDRLSHFRAQVVLGGLFELHQHVGGYLRRRILLSLDLDPGVRLLRLHHLVREISGLRLDLLEPSAHEPLVGVDGVFGVRDRLALGRSPDQHVLSRKRHYGRSRPGALLVYYHLRFAALDDRHARVGRTQVYTYHLRCHLTYSSFVFRRVTGGVRGFSAWLF